MVVKMMRWRPWPPLVTKKFEVKVVIKRLEGFDPVREFAEKEGNRLTVEIKWKGPKMALSSLRRTAVKMNYTKEMKGVDPDGVVQWDEEFQSVCSLSAYKGNVFHPWEIALNVFNGLNQGTKNKVPVIGKAALNLSEYVSVASEKELELNFNLTTPPGVSAENCPSLRISLSFLELRTAQETIEPVQRSILPVPSPPGPGETVSTEKDEISALKAGLRKVKIFTESVSTKKKQKASCEEEVSEGRFSGRSDDGEYNYPVDSDSNHQDDETDETKEEDLKSVRKSFSYGTLANVNYAGGSFYNSMRINGENEDWVYYSNRKSDAVCSQFEDLIPSVSEPSLLQSSKRGLLSWRKRKLSFRSPKAKGEPLLKKAYGEEGGDDIDHCRRQLSSDESLALGWHKTEEDSFANRSSVCEFGEDHFAVGIWEQKEIISRDGHMKLQTQVFLASIDQRSERAAGESACTALVAVIADWFQNNHDHMPIKSQFDSLIREGSLEWRNLCDNETYRDKFPDKHFDLETVLQAKIRPLSIIPVKSFIGFFHPEGMDEEKFNFLHGAMSFDSIWDEISRTGSECTNNGEPWVFIVSWNDHFFILRVEREAYYIVDTLGERLYEGCNQAYILKFDRNTAIYKMPEVAQSLDEKTAIMEPNNEPVQQVVSREDASAEREMDSKVEELMQEAEVLCQGKESCKEYIKNFLAAIPIRELQDDIKKGLIALTPFHQRLQIELHYTTHHLQPTPNNNTMAVEETKRDMLQTADVAI